MLFNTYDLSLHIPSIYQNFPSVLTLLLKAQDLTKTLLLFLLL